MELTGKRIFLVEDEPLLLMDLQDLVEDFGCTVVASELNAGSALASARSLAVDVAVLDINLNGEPSDLVAEMLAGRGIPFIFASGYGSATRLLAHASHPVIGKPYNSGQLKDALLLALGAAQASPVKPGLA